MSCISLTLKSLLWVLILVFSFFIRPCLVQWLMMNSSAMLCTFNLLCFPYIHLQVCYPVKCSWLSGRTLLYHTFNSRIWSSMEGFTTILSGSLQLLPGSFQLFLKCNHSQKVVHFQEILMCKRFLSLYSICKLLGNFLLLLEIPRKWTKFHKFGNCFAH